MESVVARSENKAENRNCFVGLDINACMAKHDMKFHKEIGFPDRIDIPTGRISVNPTDHSKNRSDNHKHGEFDIPNEVFVHEDDVIELKTRNGNLWRMLIRVSYNETYDICIVLNVNTNEVVTAWRNRVTDTHDILDTSEYDSPSDF